MTSAQPVSRRTRVRPSRRRTLTVSLRRGLAIETRMAFALATLAVLITLGVTLFTDEVPFTGLMLPLLLGSLLLGRARSHGS